jgi:hypothetical protein
MPWATIDAEGAMISDSGVVPELSPARSSIGSEHPSGRLLAVKVVTLAVALAIWWWALASTNIADIAGYGLVAALPPTFYIALGIVLISTILTLVATQFSRVIALGHLVVIQIMFFATPAVVYSVPQYSWVYKHFGVIRYLELHGATNRSLDIYENWPGFFAGNAWLDRATGSDPQVYAAWAPLFFELCTLAAALYAFGGVISNPRRRYAAALLWVLGSWVGQDYLAPQAFGWLMVVASLGVILRVGFEGGWNRAPMTWVGRFSDRLRDGIGQRTLGLIRSPRDIQRSGEGDPPNPTAPALNRRIAVFLVLVLGAAVISSHQLSPVYLILGLLAIVTVTGWRCLWPVIAVLVIGEIIWIKLAWQAIGWGWFIDTSPPVPPLPGNQVPPPAGVSFVYDVKTAMGIAFLLLGCVGIIRMLRRAQTDPRSPAILAALGLSPYVIVPFQSYGGEVGLRAYLFSLPWLSVLMLESFWPSGTRVTDAAPASDEPPSTEVDEGALSRYGTGTTLPSTAKSRLRSAGARRRPWGLVVVAPLLAAGLIFSYFGPALVEEVTPSDVAVAAWWQQNLPRSGVIYWLGDTSVGNSGSRQPAPQAPQATIADIASIRRALHMPDQRLIGVRLAMNSVDASVAYLVITPDERNFLRYHGILSQADVDALIADLRAAPDFHVLYDQGGSIVFAYKPVAPFIPAPAA